MNKGDLVEALVKSNPTISKKTAGDMIDTTLEAIGTALAKGDQVQLIGFGTFYTSKREPRAGRNPRTGAELQIKGGTTPKFRPGKGLKDKVAG